MDDLIFPPLPPVDIFDSVNTILNDISQGTFDYIKSSDYKEMLDNAYQAVTQTESWDFVKQPIKSFMFSKDPKIGIIIKKMEELGYHEHSGCSFGCIMRDMQYIAVNGEELFKVNYLSSNYEK